MTALSERIEARARVLYAETCPGRPWERAFTANHFRREAREALILAWADANPEAMEALLVGHAAVVPSDRHAPRETWLPKLDLARTKALWAQLVALTRLDRAGA